VDGGGLASRGHGGILEVLLVLCTQRREQVGGCVACVACKMESRSISGRTADRVGRRLGPGPQSN
jgi:hypothetical protein